MPLPCRAPAVFCARSILLTALAPHRLSHMPTLLAAPIFSHDERGDLDGMRHVASFQELPGGCACCVLRALCCVLCAVRGLDACLGGGLDGM